MVTVASVLILEALVLGGYLVYLRSSYVASWATDNAAFFAEDLVSFLEGDPLDETIAREFVLFSGYVPVLDEPFGSEEHFGFHSEVLDEVAPAEFDADVLIIYGLDLRMLASNDHRRYPPALLLTSDTLPKFNPSLLQAGPLDVESDGFESPKSSSVYGNDHIGQSVLIDDSGLAFGGVYYRTAEAGGPFSWTTTVVGLGLVLGGAALVALVLSGRTDGLSARPFGRRLKRLSVASAALAAGDLDRKGACHWQR